MKRNTKDMKLSKIGENFRKIYPPKKDISYAVEIMRRYVRVEINQSQFDALVSFICHLGEEVFASSIVLKALNKGDYIQAGHNFEYIGRMTRTESLRRKEGALFNGNYK